MTCRPGKAGSSKAPPGMSEFCKRAGDQNSPTVTAADSSAHSGLRDRWVHMTCSENNSPPVRSPWRVRWGGSRIN